MIERLQGMDGGRRGGGGVNVKERAERFRSEMEKFGVGSSVVLFNL